jgi:ribosomal protein S18 acetylase RimI-like enzyme
MAPYPTPKTAGEACAGARARRRSGDAAPPWYRSPVRVRPIEDGDFEEALDLFAAVSAEGLWLATEAPIDRREVRARWKDLLASGEGTILVADDGAIVGLAAMLGRTEPELGMLVRADRRRRGVGAALVRGCVAWAQGRGARRVVLHVFPHNEAAIALYHAQGFVERGTVRKAYARKSGESWDAIRMVKELYPPPAPPKPKGRA